MTSSLRSCIIQWNPSNPDTIGPEESALIREVSLFHGLKSTQTRYLGRKNVSCLERCPYFRGVLIEGFHCMSGRGRRASYVAREKESRDHLQRDVY